MASVSISDELHKKLKIYCVKKGIRIKEFVEGALRKELKGGKSE